MLRAVFIDPRGGRWFIDVPETRRERMRGLRGSAPPKARHGLLLRRCRSIHTFGMSFPIEAVFLDPGAKVIAAVSCGPRRVRLRLRARSVLECAPGSGLRPGDRLLAE